MKPAQRPRKATIYDIALAAETSPSTVSIVLNGHGERYRIKQETAGRILQIAQSLDYNVNSKARALRLSKSGLAGMVIANYRNRFFAELVETFEARARERDLCPLVASAQRDPATEHAITSVLLHQQVEMIFFAGVKHPDPLNALCREQGVPCVNLDLPGRGAPSIVTDNRLGARQMTERIIARAEAASGGTADMLFIGGHAGEYATDERLKGFEDACAAASPRRTRTILCGYEPARARAAMHEFHALGSGPPAGLFVNSNAVLEGVTQFMLELEAPLYRGTMFGCFDWDPLAINLPFVVGMIKQDVDGIIDAAFGVIEAGALQQDQLLKIDPKPIFK